MSKIIASDFIPGTRYKWECKTLIFKKLQRSHALLRATSNKIWIDRRAKICNGLIIALIVMISPFLTVGMILLLIAINRRRSFICTCTYFLFYLPARTRGWIDSTRGKALVSLKLSSMDGYLPSTDYTVRRRYSHSTIRPLPYGRL